MKSVIFFIVLFAISSGIPQTRAIEEEKEQKIKIKQDVTEPQLTTENGVTEPPGKRIICAEQTPCAWSVYDRQLDAITMTIVNSYCDCSPETECQLIEEVNVPSFIYLCKPPM